MAVEQQVLIIYAATKGYLDDVALDKVASWEDGFHRYISSNHPEIVDEIVDKSVKQKNKMSNDLLNKLNAAIEEYKQTAAPSSDDSTQKTAEAAQKAAGNAQPEANAITPRYSAAYRFREKYRADHQSNANGGE